MGQAQEPATGRPACITPGCDRPRKAKTDRGNGLCHACQARERYHRKNPGAKRHPVGYHGKWKGVTCKADGCDSEAKCKGYCTPCWQREYHKTYEPPAGSNRRRQIRYRYGITPEDYARMLAEQDGKCAICLDPPHEGNTLKRWNGKLAIDHCHDTGTVRGLLCNNCNLVVGRGRDSATLQRAVEYVRRHER